MAVGDVERVRLEATDEGAMDAVETVVGFSVATPCPTRVVEIACRPEEDASAVCVELCATFPEGRYAADDRETIDIEEVGRAVSAAIEELDDCAASPRTVDWL